MFLASLSKYKYYIIGLLILAGLCGINSSIRENTIKKQLVTQTAVTEDLRTKLIEANIAIKALDIKLKESKAETEQARNSAKAAQNKVDALLIKYKPTTKTEITVTPENCEALVAEYKQDISTLIVEIHADRALIASLENENTLLKEKITLLESESDSLTSLVNVYTETLHKQEATIQKEKTKVKFLAGASATATVIIVILLL